MAMLFAIVGVQRAFAQTLIPSEVGEGTFYLYNVGEKKFLTSGNWWGTHDALDDDGMAITLAGSGSQFTLSTAVAYSGCYVGNNGYMDNANAATWTFTKVDDTNTYKLSTMGEGEDPVTIWLTTTSNVIADYSTDEPTTDAGYWQLFTKEQLIANLASATPENPVDASFYMTNPKIRRNWPIAIQGTELKDRGSFNAGVSGLYDGGCGSLGQYRKEFDNYFAMTGVANGKYSVTVKGFTRYDNAETNGDAYLYANEKMGQKLVALGDNAGNATDATKLFVNNKYLTEALEVVVKDGKLQVGVKSDGKAVDWCTFTQFTIKMLDPYLSFAAKPFTGSGDLEAGQWYAYNVVSEGDYDFSTITGIETTEDALLSEVSPVALENTTVNLTVGTLFFKSATSQALVITPKKLVYELGEPTITPEDGAYMHSLSEVVLNYANAETNDENASLAIVDKTKKVTLYDADKLLGEATLSAEGNVLTATFTPAVPFELGKSYTVKVEAGIFGYEGKDVANEALTFIFNAPLIADGTYYFKQADADGEKKYFSRGANWGSRNTIDVYGIAYELAALPSGAYSFKNVDASLAAQKNLYIGVDYHNDQATVLPLYLTSVEGGYTISADKAEKYFAFTAADAQGQYELSTTDVATDALVWTLLSKEEYDAEIADAQKAQYKALAQAIGLDGIESAEALAAATDAYEHTSLTDKIKTPALNNSVDGWTIGKTVGENGGAVEGNMKNGVVAEFFNASADFYQDITGLDEGLYMVTVDAFYRVGGKEGAKKVGEQGGANPYLYAGSNRTPIVTWDKVRPNGGGEPNDRGEAKAGFEKGLYKNTVYAYVGEEGTLRIGIYKAGRINEDWLPFANFTLTRIAPKTAEVSITDAEYTAYVTTFDVDFAKTEGVTAYKVTEATTAGVVLEEIEKVPAGEAVILNGSNDTYTIMQATSAVGEIENELFKAGDGKVAGNGSTIYALGGTSTKDVGFYLVKAGTPIPETKGYLEIVGGLAKTFIPLGGEGEATGIEAVEAQGNEAAVIYNLAGQRVANPTNGIYIVNGKKVLINK